MMTGEATLAAAKLDTGTAADRLGLLFDAHHQRLYRLARRMSRNADEARDLVQDTFLRAVRSPKSIPCAAPDEEAWLVRVLVNLCRDRCRREKLRERFTATTPPTAMTSGDLEAALVARSTGWTHIAADRIRDARATRGRRSASHGS
jgi:RNA polymerase sigma factor (sigma-70 family)